MTARPHVARGSIAAYFRKETAIAQMSARRRTYSVMAGDSHGQTTAESFITGRQPSRMGPPGANARSWFGGTTQRKNGPGSTTRTTRKTSHQQPLTSSMSELE